MRIREKRPESNSEHEKDRTVCDWEKKNQLRTHLVAEVRILVEVEVQLKANSLFRHLCGVMQLDIAQVLQHREIVVENHCASL